MPDPYAGELMDSFRQNRLADRIIADPCLIDFGYISAEAEQGAMLWNTGETEVGLIDIEILRAADGIARETEGTGVIGAGREAEMTYTVNAAGVPFDSTYRFVFTPDFVVATQRLLCWRGKVFTERPLARAYAETREWPTDGLRSITGVEIRRARSNEAIPLRATQASFAARSRQGLASLQAILSYGLRRALIVPLWHSEVILEEDSDGVLLTPVGELRWTEFDRVDLVAVLSPQGSLRGIGVIDHAWEDTITLRSALPGCKEGDSVIPLILAPPGPTVSGRVHDEQRGLLDVTFEEIGLLDTWATLPVLSLTEYLGYPVLDLGPTAFPDTRILDALNQDAANAFTILGELWQVRFKVANQDTEQVLGLSLRQRTQTDRGKLRNFFDLVQGRYQAFWLASQKADLRLAAAASASASTIVVYPCELDLGLTEVTRHAYFPSTGQMVKISAPVAAGDNTQLTVSPVLSADLAAEAAVQFLYLVRFDTDSLTIAMDGQSNVTSETVLAVRELQGETP